MLKILFAFIIFISCSNLVQSQIYETYFNENDLNIIGKVKRIQYYKNSDPITHKDSFAYRSYIDYNISGYPVEEIIFDTTACKKYKMNYFWNDNEQITDIREYTYANEDAIFDGYYKYLYDDKGNLIEQKEILIDDPELSVWITYHYDENNQVYERKDYYEDDDFEEIEENKDYWEESELEYIDKYKYDKNGVLSECNTYVATEDQRLLSRIVYERNEPKILLKKYYDAEGRLKSTLTILYDNYGNRTKYTMVSDSGSTDYSYTYEFDKVGNWIKKTVYSEGKLYYITKRSIEYY
jgi:hypothetical protein